MGIVQKVFSRDWWQCKWRIETYPPSSLHWTPLCSVKKETKRDIVVFENDTFHFSQVSVILSSELLDLLCLFYCCGALEQCYSGFVTRNCLCVFWLGLDFADIFFFSHLRKKFILKDPQLNFAILIICLHDMIESRPPFYCCGLDFG